MHALMHGVGPAVNMKPAFSPVVRSAAVRPSMQALVATCAATRAAPSPLALRDFFSLASPMQPLANLTHCVCCVLMTSTLGSPQEGFDGAVAAGTKKAGMPASRIFGLGILSGCQIGFGAYLMLSVGGACGGLVAAGNPGLKMIISGAFGLPVGLFMTLMTGAELFTGNTALVTMAMLEGKAEKAQLIKSWVSSWVGNLIGSVGFAYLVFLGGTLASGGASVPVSMAKTSLTFQQAFVRGILCNWLVCMAVYLASFAKDLTGKVTRHHAITPKKSTPQVTPRNLPPPPTPLGMLQMAAAQRRTFARAPTSRVRALVRPLCPSAHPPLLSNAQMTAIWFLISTFIALGLEHSVANMFIIPLGIFSGAAVSWKAFFLANLLPVTLGNIVGGAVCVGAAMNLAYGTWMK